jgi:pimeloyl-ACP methyl ester carboxylesterase
MAELHVEGIRVHYRESGSGPPVVLLHAGTSSSAQWRRVDQYLASRCRTYAPDLHGHGATDPWPGPAEARTHDAEAALAGALIDHIARPVHLVAHSYGASIALRLLLGRPRGVSSAFLLEPNLGSVLRDGAEPALHDEYVQTMRNFIAQAGAGQVDRAWSEYLAANENPGTWDGMKDEARSRLRSSTDLAVSVCHANLNNATTLAECSRITVPTTLAYGDQTKARYRRIAELLAGAIPGARLRVLPGASHMSPLTHPEAVAEAVAGHLDGL